MPVLEEDFFQRNFEGEGDTSKESQTEREGEAGTAGCREGTPGTPEPVT